MTSLLVKIHSFIGLNKCNKNKQSLRTLSRIILSGGNGRASSKKYDNFTLVQLSLKVKISKFLFAFSAGDLYLKRLENSQ
ncbi:MAG: hypothetical protein ONB44_11070 [candidate division KSB1 bacterium]|nr:hypothetical protein [candidate division KSB1 bacterium]MDZ7302665.1 hypothetical protein [candidate division KSB1 bacterium]MDZ7311805.1 hypothetical protein [candidate division KSB1 bacterium]